MGFDANCVITVMYFWFTSKDLYLCLYLYLVLWYIPWTVNTFGSCFKSATLQPSLDFLSILWGNVGETVQSHFPPKRMEPWKYKALVLATWIELYKAVLCLLRYKGWLAIAELKPLPLFISLWNREMKSESGYSLAMASQPLYLNKHKKGIVIILSKIILRMMMMKIRRGPIWNSASGL